MKHRPLPLGLLLLLTCIAPSSAQKAYRCGPDGNTFQQTPCAQGEAIDVSDPRSAEQRREAKAVAKREAQLAAQLERERLKREAEVVPAMATGINGQPIPPAASTPSSGKSKKKSKRKKVDTKPFTVLAPKPAKQ